MPSSQYMAAAMRRQRLAVCSRACGIAAAMAAAAAVAIFVDFGSWPRVTWLRFGFGSDASLVELTLVSGAREKGALCLDGSPPGYNLQRGFGSGLTSWVLHLEGGGWCNTIARCSDRKRTHLGSSRYMNAEAFDGILSNEPLKNPDFYNWNKVVIRYCDGASFSGDVESEFQNGTELFFRGLRIWEASVDELLTKGLADAKQALLTGCSAGGLATILHCNDFHARLPQNVAVKCLADGGFFLDEKDISGKRTMRSFYSDVVHLQNVGKVLPKDCVANMEPAKCFFPGEIMKSVNTPMFILNSAYDSWQIPHVLAPEESDPQGPQQSWLRCKNNIHYCDSAQIEVLQAFRKALINTLKVVQDNRDHGMFINSCFRHCQTVFENTWYSPLSPRINNKTVAEAVGDWYFNRREVKEIDCAYPCNPTCDNMEPA